MPVDILIRIPKYVLMKQTMERLNLNVPKEVRKRLRNVAKQRGRTESAVARDLLVEAVDEIERQEFYRRAIEAYTPERRKRDLEILAAFEKLDRRRG